MTRLKFLYANFEELVSAFLLAVMAVFAFLNVLTRYLIHYSFAFTEEIEVALLVWITMLGAAAGFRRGIHLGFNFLSSKIPPIGQKLFLLTGSVLAVFCFGILLRYSIVQIQDELTLQVTTEALGIPQWWYTIALTAGSLLVIFRVVEITVNNLRRNGD
ncbi:MAG TPA: TRAP transporter small permease [Syntrophales bacterium]|nr:TRAP transporter small permease [Syntrophales bacterium]